MALLSLGFFMLAAAFEVRGYDLMTFLSFAAGGVEAAIIGLGPHDDR